MSLERCAGSEEDLQESVMSPRTQNSIFILAAQGSRMIGAIVEFECIGFVRHGQTELISGTENIPEFLFSLQSNSMRYSFTVEVTILLVVQMSDRYAMGKVLAFPWDIFCNLDFLGNCHQACPN